MALGLGQTPARRRAVSWADDNSVQLATLIHPSADISKTAAIGRGCIVHSGTVIWSNSVVGECTFVSPGSLISHDARVGSYCHLAMGSRIGSAVTMESDVQVGISATIMTGVRTVGRGCVIGAGAVVIRDVAQHTTVAGVPARVIASPE